MTMERWAASSLVIVALLLIAVQLVESAEGERVGRDLKYFKSMSFPNQVDARVLTANTYVGEKVRALLAPQAALLICRLRCGFVSTLVDFTHEWSAAASWGALLRCPCH